MSFNLQDYTTVAERIKIFWELHPEGAIRTELIEYEGQRFIFKASLYRTATDAMPFATGFAHEIVADRGVNKEFALENCETSAVGIAAKNAGIGTDKHAISREEAQKVERVTKPEKWFPHEGDARNYGDENSPNCEHGPRMLREGISDKTGKAFHGWTCLVKDRDQQCLAIWYVLDVHTGQWEAPE